MTLVDMPSQRDYQSAEREQNARERGKTIPHYAGKVVRKLATRGKGTATTPSKRGAK